MAKATTRARANPSPFTPEPQAESKPLEAPAAADAPVADGPQATAALMQAGRAYWDAVSTLNGELASFVARRLQHDIDLGQSVAGCEDWQKLARLQQDWARTALEEYAGEAASLVQLCSEANLACWQGLYGQMAAASLLATAEPTRPAAH